MGKVRVGGSIAGIISAALAGVFIDSVPVQWVFAVATLISLPGALTFFKIQYQSDSQGFGTRRPMR